MRKEVQQLYLAKVHDPESQTEHTQVRVASLCGPVEVDAGMVVILQRLWAKGVDTSMSCEDNLGSVWICMSLYDHDTLIHKARASADLLFFLQSCLCEIRAGLPEDYNGMVLEPGDEDFVPPTRVDYRVSIRFPARHKELFEQLLADWEVPTGTWPHKRARLAYSDAESARS
jgi:hypothetical protein